MKSEDMDYEKAYLNLSVMFAERNTEIALLKRQLKSIKRKRDKLKNGQAQVKILRDALDRIDEVFTPDARSVSFSGIRILIEDALKKADEVKEEYNG